MKPLRPALLALLVVVGVVTGLLVGVPSPAVPAAAEPRTWVVDAIDDGSGNRWESVDTGTATVTVQVGDTVEWRFDRAAIDHDLTSQDSRSVWSPALAEYRVPGGAPVRHTFTTPGTYDYLCSIHGTLMRGVVVVADPDNRAPVVEPTVEPRSGPAPLAVHFTAVASDPDGDPLSYRWDFGTGDPDDRSTDLHAMFAYDVPGTYPATLEVTDGRGGRTTAAFTITAGPGDGATEPPAGDPSYLPAIAATATPAAGPAPLAVALSTRVTTTGRLGPFADGTSSYPGLAGSVELVRSRGRTDAALSATGLKPGAAHLVHVHEQSCANGNGGAHFRFDETRPFAAENEIWLPFTSGTDGTSGPVQVSRPLRAGVRAVSLVIHDPDNPSKRIGCADLDPALADLTYTWDFGDGSSGTGADPDHTYARAGSYTARVTVRSAHAGHGMGEDGSVTAAVTVTVPDTTGPVVRGLRPRGTVRDRTPAVRATVRDADSVVRRVTLRVDGRTVAARYDARRGRLTWTPRRPLTPGRHVLRVLAVDAAGNRTESVGRFRVRR